MHRITAVVRLLLVSLLWGALAVTLPVGTALAQSRHADGRGMHWTKIGGAGPLTPGALSLVVDSLNMTGGGTDVSACANACFAANYQQSTVPYYSLDVARSVTLLYSSISVAARPVIFADVHISSSSTKTLVEYDLQATFNDGGFLHFLNGDSKLRFSAPSPQTTEVRLAGQFDNRLYPTELDSVVFTITAVYSDLSTEQQTFTTSFVGLNTSGSSLGRGWILAGRQILTPYGSGKVLITNGDGSGSWFAPKFQSCPIQLHRPGNTSDLVRARYRAV